MARLQSSANLSHVFLGMSTELAAFGLINAAAVLEAHRWPVLRGIYAVVRD